MEALVPFKSETTGISEKSKSQTNKIQRILFKEVSGVFWLGR